MLSIFNKLNEFVNPVIKIYSLQMKIRFAKHAQLHHKLIALMGDMNFTPNQAIEDQMKIVHTFLNALIKRLVSVEAMRNINLFYFILENAHMDIQALFAAYVLMNMEKWIQLNAKNVQVQNT